MFRRKSSAEKKEKLISGRTEAVWAEINANVARDPDYLHPTETKALAELKAEHADLLGHAFFRGEERARFITACLFARKLDVKRTAELLKNHLAWREKHNLVRILDPSEVNGDIMRTGYAMAPRGGFDKEGHSVQYVFPGRINFDDFTVHELLVFTAFSVEHQMRTWPFKNMRLGVTYVEDLAGVSMRSMTSGHAKAVFEGVQQAFPIRFAHIYMRNQGRILKFLLAFARLFVRQKIMQRVRCVTEEELHELISPDNLIKEHGGTLKYNHQEACDAALGKRRGAAEQRDGVVKKE